MGSSFVGDVSKLLQLGVIILFLFHHLNLLVLANPPDYFQPQKPQKASCHDEERSALLQFFNTTSAKYSSCKPADLRESSNCCSWDGVECDQKTGHVTDLYLPECNFSGLVPSSLGNLRHLTYLDLSYNKFSGPLPAASFSNLTQLTQLYLNFNDFSGYIPPSLGNLTQLTELWMNSNHLTGTIPSSLGNRSTLTDLYLGSNKLHGSIPHSFSNLINLQLLSLDKNNLSGIVDFYLMFQGLQYLSELDLSTNKLDVLIETRHVNASLLPKYTYLGLGSCNIREFPDFLRYQDGLTHLDLSGNKLHGLVPKWLSKTGSETLWLLNLAYNFLLGFDHPRGLVLPWSGLAVLYLSYNMLDGLPVPLPTVEYYGISDNRLTGEIPPFVCNLSSLQNLDLSNNNLSGELPQCLGNFSLDLQVLNLGNNSFHGALPSTFSKMSNLTMIDVSRNQLQGQLPRSLANCVQLEFLVLSNNEFSDVFPFWLGTLPELQLLAMRHNQFYGMIGIGNLKNHHGFPKLHVVDLSYNNFTGEFPTEYIFSGKSMRGTSLSQPAYVNTSLLSVNFGFSVTITSKGVERYFAKVNADFMAIDLSSNKFEGKIPEYLGTLKGLRSLNISNNLLNGSIPSSLGNLTVLESLDLSQNKLSGQIPQQLKRLTFLSQFNVSCNNLTGPIPTGTQFTSFSTSAYEGNLGLCGDPLPKKCGNPQVPQLSPPSSIEENKSGSDGLFEFDWKFVLAGCGSGFVVGVVLADVAVTRRQDLFIKIVGMVSLTISKLESWGRHRN